MLTAIEIDDELMAQAMQTTGLASRTAVVEAALQGLVSGVPGLRLAAGTREGFRQQAGAEWSPIADAAQVLCRQAELDLFAAAMGFDKVE